MLWQNKNEFPGIITWFICTIMSIDDGDIRKCILRLARKSVTVDYNPDSLQEPGNYSEYRTKFLERRKQFEQPPPPVQKQPFLPHWVKSEYDTDLPITYKKRGNEITDVRIIFFKNGDGNNHTIGNRMELYEPAGVIDSAENLPNKDLKINDGPKVVIMNGDEANSPGIKTTFHCIDENSSGTSKQRVERRMDGHKRYARSIKRFQSLGTIQETSSSMSSGIKSNSVSNRIVDMSKKNPSTALSTDSVILRKPIVCRPIIRKAIELKKYDHIIMNVIRKEK